MVSESVSDTQKKGTSQLCIFLFIKSPTHLQRAARLWEDGCHASCRSERSTPSRQTTLTRQVVQAQTDLWTSTLNTLADFCHRRENRKGRDSARMQNVLSWAGKPLQLLKNECCQQIWLLAGQKISEEFSVIVVVWQYFWYWIDQWSWRKQKKIQLKC